MPKKKFIDKKNSVTFHLVHRSQKDPLVADETAPQHVLLPVTNSKVDKKSQEERSKYGIYFDDEYNYLQHLKTAENKAEWVQVEKEPETSKKEYRLKLPSSVFASKVEEEVGMLNKAAPQSGLRLDLDPDIVAAMDEDFDYENPDNELEDDFMEMANAEKGECDEEDFSSDFSDEELDEVGSLERGQFTFKDEETKSRFTDYSMSSSVIRRNEQLSLLDEKFEHMFTGYDENEIGALDCDEIEGHVPESADILLQYADEFEKDRKREILDRDAVLAKILANSEMADDGEDNEELMKMEVKTGERWDCESILSTYSNIYNHPKLIKEQTNKIRIHPRTGMPMNVLGENKLTAKALSKLNEQNEPISSRGGAKSVGGNSIISTLSTLSIRPKDETPEERKERKKQLREYRHERRIERKANAEAFKEEAKRQIKIQLNNRNNVQGNKIL